VKRIVEKGKTLLVDGPASVKIISGEVEVLGAELRTGIKMVIREGKRIPLEVKRKAEFDMTLGEKAATNEVEGSTIPVSWEKASSEVLGHEKPVTVMVMGGVDCGKTSFCAYLANKALEKKRRVTIIDADLGQADVGPPSTIGSCQISKPIRDPFETGAQKVCFVGVTSPSGAVSRVVEGLVDMKNEALRRNAEILIINTDGWIEGEDAVHYKVALTEKISPGIVVGIQQQNELAPILDALTQIKTIVVDSPSAARKRDREERRLLRELGYKKYLKGARTESFPLWWARVAGVPFGTRMPPSKERMKNIVEFLKATPLYCEETPNSVFIALDKEQWIDKELTKDLEQRLNKKVNVVREGDEEGLLVALHDAKGSFLGIGVVEEINYERRVVKVYTPVQEGVSSLHLGRIKLDKKGREIGLGDVFIDYT